MVTALFVLLLKPVYKVATNSHNFCTNEVKMLAISDMRGFVLHFQPSTFNLCATAASTAS